ncbi:MAG: CopG family transcriptional regulator [Verrucomicrobiota bacterium]
MKNVTITLPDEVALHARIWAAEADTSLSGFLSRMLSERMERESGYQRAQENFLSRQAVSLQQESQPYPKRADLHDRSNLR